MSTGRRNILETGLFLAGVAWSPDGSKLVGTQAIATDPDAEQIRIVDVADGTVTVLELDCDTGCGFSSGEFIAMSPEWPFAAITSDDDLWVVNLDDGSLRSLAHGTAEVYRWTMDNWIYFSRSARNRDDSTVPGLFRVRSDGTDLQLVADIDDDCGLEQFSVAPDGMRAVCTVLQSEPDVKLVDFGDQR